MSKFVNESWPVQCTTIFHQNNISLKFGKNLILKKGKVKKDYDEETVSEYLKKNEIKIEVDLNCGKFVSNVWTCDLTKKYIEINADYRS